MATLPRPVLLALLGMGLVLAAFLITRTIASAPSATVSPVAERPAAPASPSEAPPAGRERASRASAPVPSRVRAALRRRDVVVLLFRERRGADDAATARAVRVLRRQAPEGVTVAEERVRRLPAYAGVVGSLDVSQAPAVVIVGRDRRARLLEGYLDAPSLRQHVRDAKR